MAAILYRVEQFWNALTARVTADDIEWATPLLPPAAGELFLRQPHPDQRHALAVCRLLIARGWEHPDLLAAALLHDVGKAEANLTLLYRAAIVLLERLAPSLLVLLSGDGTASASLPAWRRPFAFHARHAAIGAQQAQRAGCSALTVALIRRHHEPIQIARTEEERLLLILQHADNQC